jgi:hypothetical protein
MNILAVADFGYGRRKDVCNLSRPFHNPHGIRINEEAQVSARFGVLQRPAIILDLETGLGRSSKHRSWNYQTQNHGDDRLHYSAP